MIFTIGKNELLSVVNVAAKAVKNKTTMPILECIRIYSTGTALVLEATNMEFAIRTEIPCIADQGSVCINAKRLSDILKKMPDTDITIAVSKKYEVTVSAGKKIKFEIPAQSDETFPGIKEENGDKIFIPAADLREAVIGTAFCTAGNDTNKMMTGIQMLIKNGRVRFCALDGHRIGIRTTTLENVPDKEYDITIPVDYLQEVVKVLPNENVEITINAKNVMFKTANTVITTRLLDGDYFNIEKMLSVNEFSTSVTVNRSDIYSTIDRASLILEDEHKRPVVLNINEEGTMKISGRSGIGKIEEEVGVEKTGQDVRIGFNPRYLLEIIKNVPEEKMTMNLVNALSPAIIKDNEDKYLYLLLPINMPAQDNI